jgi:hypothetical protein
VTPGFTTVSCANAGADARALCIIYDVCSLFVSTHCNDTLVGEKPRVQAISETREDDIHIGPR